MPETSRPLFFEVGRKRLARIGADILDIHGRVREIRVRAAPGWRSVSVTDPDAIAALVDPVLSGRIWRDDEPRPWDSSSSLSIEWHLDDGSVSVHDVFPFGLYVGQGQIRTPQSFYHDLMHMAGAEAPPMATPATGQLPHRDGSSLPRPVS